MPGPKTPSIPRWKLSLTRTPIGELAPNDWQELVPYFKASYEIDEASLRRSLSTRTHLFRVRERATGRLVATTSTGAMSITIPGGKSVRGLYGGDSLLLPEVRGSGLMQEFAVRTLLADMLQAPRAVRYGFGVALTHLMYVAIVRSFPDVWPQPDRELTDEHRQIMEVLGRQMYQEKWQGAEQPVDAGRVGREKTLLISQEMMKDPHVRFFVERNPSNPQTALPVLMKLDGRNLAAVLRRMLGKW